MASRNRTYRGVGPRVTAGLALILLGAPTLAMAQNERGPGQRPQPPLLEGPSVDSKKAPWVHERFAPGGRMDRQDRSMIAQRPFVESLKRLGSEEAPPDVRLTPEQVERIRAILGDYERQSQEYWRPYRERLGRNGDRPGAAQPRRQQRRDADQPRQRGQEQPPWLGKPGDRPQRADRPDAKRGDRPDAKRGFSPERRGGPDGLRGDRPSPEQMTPEMRKKFTELRRKAPKPDKCQSEIWQLLTEPQRQIVTHDLEAFRKEMEAKRGEQEVQRRLKQGRDAKAAQPRSGQGERSRDEISDLRQRLLRLTPEERRELIRSLREDRD